MKRNTKRSMLELIKRLSAEIYRHYCSTGEINNDLLNYVDDAFTTLRNSIRKGEF